MQQNPSTQFTLDLPLHEIALLGFYLVTGLFVVFTMIMYYHWNEYSTETAVTRVTGILYIAITTPLILSIGILTYFIH